MTCVIIDDEPHTIDVLKRYIDQTESLQLLETFRNPLKALQFLQLEKPDLLFLDINMPGINGIQFLRSLAQNPLVIFTTAYSEYGAESYEWDAADYLLKPIVFERFLKAVQKAGQILQKRNPVSEGDRVIPLKSGGEVYPVRLSDILFITKDSNYLEVHTKEGNILIRANMNDVFSIFPESLFCRIHKSHVVAMGHVKMADTHTVVVNEIRLPLGASYRGEFERRLTGDA